MKKFLFSLAALVVVASTATAQNEAVWGVRAGVSFANMSVKSDGAKMSIDTRTSFNAGVSYQLPLLAKAPFYLETGLYLSGRGGKTNTAEFVGEDIEGKTSINMLYVQLPVMLSWHFNINSVSLQPVVGAYYGLGISGKAKLDNVNEKVNLFKSTSLDGEELGQLFKRSEVGLRFGLNVVIKKHYMIGASYDLGLTNIVKDKEAAKEGTARNGSFNISLGYNF